MSERGTCAACSIDLTPDNSSKLRSGKVIHIGCPRAVTENRFSVPTAETVKAEVPASQPAEIAPNAPPRKGRRMTIGAPVGCSEEVRQAVAADPALKAKVERVGLAEQLLPKPSKRDAMFAKMTALNGHGPSRSVIEGGPILPGSVADAIEGVKPVAGQRTPDAAEESRRKVESAERMKTPGPRAEAERSGLSAPPDPVKAVVEGARVAAEAWKSTSAKMATAFAGVKLPENLSPDDTAAAAEDDFEPPELCSVCHKPKSKRLGLVLSTGTHLRCKPAQIRAQAEATLDEVKTEKEALAEELAEKEDEVKERDAELEAVTEHPEIGEVAQRLIDDLPLPGERAARNAEQAALLKEPPPRHHFGGASDGGVLDVSSPRETGEQIHFFGLQDCGAYPFGKDRPETIVALCGQRTAAKTRDLEPTVARLDEAGGTSLKVRNCPDCVGKFDMSTSRGGELKVFPAWVRPSQWVSQSPGVGTPVRSGRRGR